MRSCDYSLFSLEICKTSLKIRCFLRFSPQVNPNFWSVPCRFGLITVTNYNCYRKAITQFASPPPPPPREKFHIRRSGGLAPKFASKILGGAPNFASKNVGDKYPKFCPLNFRFDPKIGIFPQLLRLVTTELPKFFLLFGELGRTLPQTLPLNLMWGPKPLRPLNMEVPPWGLPEFEVSEFSFAAATREAVTERN